MGNEDGDTPGTPSDTDLNTGKISSPISDGVLPEGDRKKVKISKAAATVFVSTLLLVIGIYGYRLYQDKASLTPGSTASYPSTSPLPDRPKNILTAEKKFVNTAHNYTISYPELYEIVTPNAQTSSQVNFRRKDDKIPTHSGITVNVIESNSTLSEQCGSDLLERYGILCNKKTITMNPLLDGPVAWELYEKDIVGMVPSGYVYASAYRDGKLYYIVNTLNQDIDAYVFMTNFRFIKE